MPKLNAIVAIEKTVKTKIHEGKSELYHKIQKPQLMSGISRTYTPRDDEGEKLPSESTKVQLTSGSVLKSFAELMTELFDITATKEYANCEARADVVVDGEVIAARVPVTYLLFLNTQLIDFATFVKKIPLLDPAQDWHFDEVSDCYVSDPVETTRSKKVPKNHIKAPATDKHPAQVEIYHVDEIVGDWKKIEFSGAISATVKNKIIDRIEKLQNAVKHAKEEANSSDIKTVSLGEKMFKYALAPLSSK